MLKRPDPSEHAPYYGRYVDQVPEGDVLGLLESESLRTSRMLAAVSEEESLHRYAPGKWSIREVVGHVCDAERTFAHRALVMARADPASMPGMDQEDYVSASNAHSRALEDLVGELEAIRQSTVHLFRGFPDEAWERTGIASDVSFSVRSFPWIILGHELHHRRGLERDYGLMEPAE